MSVYEKLASVQKELRVGKSGFNPHFRSEYHELPEILNQLRPLLDKYKLCLLQTASGADVVTTLVDLEKEESKITSTITMPSGLDSQKMGSSLTYLRRYSLTGMFLVSERDDDANEATGLSAKKVEATAINPGTTNITTAAAPSTPTTTEKKKVSFSKKAFTPKAAPAAEVKSTDDDL
jgi:hypothetical protein